MAFSELHVSLLLRPCCFQQNKLASREDTHTQNKYTHCVSSHCLKTPNNVLLFLQVCLILKTQSNDIRYSPHRIHVLGASLRNNFNERCSKKTLNVFSSFRNRKVSFHLSQLLVFHNRAAQCIDKEILISKNCNIDIDIEIDKRVFL